MVTGIKVRAQSLEEVCIDGSCTNKAVIGRRRCVKCAARSARSRRKSYRKTLYGITDAEYEVLLANQNNCCKLCELPIVGTGKTRFAPTIDHDHKTGIVRGILHRSCNSGLGYFDDSPTKLRQAAAYLDKGSIP